MAILSFAEDYDRSPIYNLLTVDMEKIPPQAGAYVLLAGSKTQFLYPKGKSRVFYIGKASNLRKRLKQHFRYSIEARDHLRLSLYYPRYEYAAAFGCRFVFIRTRHGLTPKHLEEILLRNFAKEFHSWPIANGAGSWNRIE